MTKKASHYGLPFFMTMKAQFILLLILLPLTTLRAQHQEVEFPILFWNAENLFDCKDDPIKSDEDFTPEALKHWTGYRYQSKIKQMARVIIEANAWNPPAIIGLCEVENDSVLHGLTHYTGLRNLGYEFIITDSKDQRGIDVALLYQPELFKVLTTESIDVGRLPINQKFTRDILHVSGLVASGDTLDFFVAHFPSRTGGQRRSNKNRLHVAQILQNKIEEVYEIRETAHVILMGDFNDYPSNESIQKVLQVKPPLSDETRNDKTLYHLLSDSRGQKEWGTYKYKNQWGVLDHFIVSGSLLNSTSTFFTSQNQTEIIRLPFHLTVDEKYGGTKPFRTYNGMHYLGGYSDHLPIISKFTLRLN